MFSYKKIVKTLTNIHVKNKETLHFEIIFFWYWSIFKLQIKKSHKTLVKRSQFQNIWQATTFLVNFGVQSEKIASFFLQAGLVDIKILIKGLSQAMYQLVTITHISIS